MQRTHQNTETPFTKSETNLSSEFPNKQSQLPWQRLSDWSKVEKWILGRGKFEIGEGGLTSERYPRSECIRLSKRADVFLYHAIRTRKNVLKTE